MQPSSPGTQCTARDVGNQADQSRSRSRILGMVALLALLNAPAVFGNSIVVVSDDYIFQDGSEEYLDFRGVAEFLVPLAGAEISVSTATGASAHGHANADGRFRFLLESQTPNTILSVRARGVGAQATQEFASYLGDVGFLIQRAGDDRILDETGLAALKLNPHQTGLYVAMRDLPVSPLSPPNRNFERMAASYSPLDASGRGAIVAMTASGDLPLPAGASTTLAAVSDPALAVQVNLAWEQLGACPANPICVARDRVSNDPTQVTYVTPPLNVWMHSYLSFPLGQGVSAPRVRLQADGTGTYHSGGTDAGEAITVQWNVVAGIVRVTRPGSVPFRQNESFPVHPSCNCQVRQVSAVLAHRNLYIEGPRGGILLGQADEIELRYPDNPGIPTVPATITNPTVPFPTVIGDVGLQAFPDPSDSTIVLPRCANSLCTLPPGSFAALVFEPHLFQLAGTGTTARLSDAFAWSRDGEGRLHVDYASGASAIYTVASADRQYGNVVARFIDSQAVQRAYSSPYAPRSAAGFTAESLAGSTLLTTIGCDRPYGEIAEGNCRAGTRFGFVFASGGVGTMISSPDTLAWSIDASSRLVLTRTRNTGAVRERRTWELIAEDASSILVLEVVEAAPLGAQPLFTPTSRLVRYVKDGT